MHFARQALEHFIRSCPYQAFVNILGCSACIPADQAKVELRPRRNNSIAFTNHNEMRSKGFSWMIGVNGCMLYYLGNLLCLGVLLGQTLFTKKTHGQNSFHPNKTDASSFVHVFSDHFPCKNSPQQFLDKASRIHEQLCNLANNYHPTSSVVPGEISREGFGSNFQKLFDSPVQLKEKSFQIALAHAKTLEANLGGTAPW